MDWIGYYYYYYITEWDYSKSTASGANNVHLCTYTTIHRNLVVVQLNSTVDGYYSAVILTFNAIHRAQ